MANTLGVGIIGCGNIFETYVEMIPFFNFIDLRACADIDVQIAKARSLEYGIKSLTIEDLLKADDIDIIVNLTIPTAHFEVSKIILEAGKHVYTEKPYVLSRAEGQLLGKIADAGNLRIGSAPDTFLGSSHQHARKLLDEGAIGKVTSGTCHLMSHGMEDWHPSPDFFFKPGGGPIFDIGPYYLANLVQLIGSVVSVKAMASIPEKRRMIRSQPREGEMIEVEIPTTVHALLKFKNGAIISLAASWDVWAHRHGSTELYGSEGSLYIPDPNFFAGEITLTKRQEVIPSGDWTHPFSVPNQDELANYRGAGLADMAQAILNGRPHRCHSDLALHLTDVMASILTAGENGKVITVKTTCERPDYLDGVQAEALIRQGS